MYKRVQFSEIIPFSAEFEAYSQWALSNGIKTSKILYPVKFPPGYIGTMATETINPWDTIISVPNSLLLSSKVAEKSELKDLFLKYDSFFDEDDAYYEDIILITFLLWEKSKGEGSKWHIFLQNQPASPESLQDWSIEELKELQDPEALYDTKQQLAGVMKLWNAWKKTLLHSKLFTQSMVEFPEFRWAYRLLGTRTFGKFVPYTSFVPIAEYLNHHNTRTYYYYGSKEASAESARRYVKFEDNEDNDDDMVFAKPIQALSCRKLLKLAHPAKLAQDCALFKLVKEAEAIDSEDQKSSEDKNHVKPEPEVLRESEDKELCIITGNETYEAGSEVYMSYGRYSNRMLLATYGFALKDNVYDFARLVLSLDKLCREDRSCYVRAEDKGKPYIFKLKEGVLCKGKKYAEFLRAIRCLAWDESKNTDACFSPADPEIEVFVMETAMKIVAGKLSSFDTSLDQDLELLTSPRSMRHYFAVFSS